MQIKNRVKCLLIMLLIKVSLLSIIGLLMINFKWWNIFACLRMLLIWYRLNKRIHWRYCFILGSLFWFDWWNLLCSNTSWLIHWLNLWKYLLDVDKWWVDCTYTIAILSECLDFICLKIEKVILNDLSIKSM